MSAATLYPIVILVHLAADIVFIIGLLAASLLLAALSLQTAAEVARARRLAAGMLRWNRVVNGSALVLLWACGAWMAWRAGWFASGWLHAKLALVLALSALHGALSGALRRASAPAPAVPTRAWCAVAPLAAGAIAAVIWLALLKPF